jgi:hypothetical protein
MLLYYLQGFLILVEVAWLVTWDPCEEAGDIFMLLSALLNNSREKDEAIKVFGHLRGRIFDQHLHLVHKFAVDFT